MASGKVARRAAVEDIAAILESDEVAALIGQLDALRWTGRKGYGARALVGACLVKSFYGFPTWTRVAALIEEHPGLQRVLGGSPSLWACYRFMEKLRKHSQVLADCLDRVTASLRDQMPDYGRDIAIDASDMPAYGNGHKLVRKGGPERERYSDPEASWGHRSAVSNRMAGVFYGYKLHAAACTRTGLPLAWLVQTGRRQESLYVVPLLDAVRARGFQPETCAMDKGYDHKRVYAECEARGCDPVIPMRGRHTYEPALFEPRGGRLYPNIPRDSQRFRDLYRNRVAVERLFASLKTESGLTPLRVRGIAKVQLHADLTILGRLAQALIRAQAFSLAA